MIFKALFHIKWLKVNCSMPVAKPISVQGIAAQTKEERDKFSNLPVTEPNLSKSNFLKLTTRLASGKY